MCALKVEKDEAGLPFELVPSPKGKFFLCFLLFGDSVLTFSQFLSPFTAICLLLLLLTLRLLLHWLDVADMMCPCPSPDMTHGALGHTAVVRCTRSDAPLTFPTNLEQLTRRLALWSILGRRRRKQVVGFALLGREIPQTVCAPYPLSLPARTFSLLQAVPAVVVAGVVSTTVISNVARVTPVAVLHERCDGADEVRMASVQHDVDRLALTESIEYACQSFISFVHLQTIFIP